MGGPRAALALALVLALALPLGSALTQRYGACGGRAPDTTRCEFVAHVGWAGGFCTPTMCVPGGYASAGGASVFTGTLTVRAQQMSGAGGGSSHATCAILAGAGACEPDWTPRAWPMLAPGDWRVSVRVDLGEGEWWGAIDGLAPS